MHRPPELRLSSARRSSRSEHSRSRPRNPCSSCPRVSPWKASFPIGTTDGTTEVTSASRKYWSGRQDSNLRPLAPHASALPGCATPRPRDRMIAQKGLENLTAAILSGEESCYVLQVP